MRGSMSTMSGDISISCRSMPYRAATLRAYTASSGIASSFWSSGRKVIVYASTELESWWARTVTMLESSPPDRKLDTGTSATRCALTDSSITDFRSAAGWRAACGGHVLDPPVLPDLGRAPRLDAGPGAGRELVHALDRAALLGHPVVQHGRDEGPGLDAQLAADRGDDRLQLGGEDDAVAAPQVEERLDAERVARQDELAGHGVGQREREHAAEPVERRRAPVPPGLEHHLGVG